MCVCVGVCVDGLVRARTRGCCVRGDRILGLYILFADLVKRDVVILVLCYHLVSHSVGKLGKQEDLRYF